jgi:hypothetical protein
LSEPLKENEALESELIDELWKVFDLMLHNNSQLPRRYLEDFARPLIRLSLLDATIKEACRCDVYGQLGSPRTQELKNARNKQEWEAAKVRAKLR